MKTLRLNEGDMIRITGAQLPKGKFVKLQAQSVDFLEVSDPKAVCVFLQASFESTLSYIGDWQAGASFEKLLDADARRHHRDHLQSYRVRHAHNGNKT